ncbi:sugar ABC transporter substrate-binding protein [Paenibacillus filicis]|uniref:Sugar ABC transporter substrate-binding protein n=1 Tax=Paenibacillus gyeongsangnamensis TaxID=3388067 RepID=A0ABT4Q3V7_9BACL|nr:sugar ABC transporter substrate-binding protein [Paenibacillus filicis]MCZ8511556.1 sugar ABC transporter substrate-binding protein [Paenibacillus filicis]
MRWTGKASLALVFAASISLAGCGKAPGAAPGGNTAAGGAAPAKQSINMLYWPGPESDAMQKVVADYNKGQGTQDGVEVKMAPAPREGFWEKEAAMMSAGNKDVDVYMTASYKVGEQQNSLLPLDDKLGNGLNLFLKPTLDSLKVGGKTYGIPMDVSNHFMYYRKDLTDKLLSDPAWQAKYKEVSQKVVGKALDPKKPDDWNWDDFTATAAFFTKSLNADSPTQYGTALQGKNLEYNVQLWDDVLYSMGGTWFKDGKANFDTPETKKALAVYANIMKQQLSPASASTFEYPETNQAFQTGKAAVILQWSAAYHELSDKTKSPQVYDKVAIAPIPGDKHATHIHALAVGINNKSDKQDAALKWMKYLSTTNAMKMYAQNGGIPSVSDVLNSMKDTRPEFPFIATHVDKYGFVEDTSANVFPILGILAKDFSAAWAGQTDVDSAAKTAQKDVTALLEKK